VGWIFSESYWKRVFIPLTWNINLIQDSLKSQILFASDVREISKIKIGKISVLNTKWKRKKMLIHLKLINRGSKDVDLVSNLWDLFFPREIVRSRSIRLSLCMVLLYYLLQHEVEKAVNVVCYIHRLTYSD